MSVLYWFLVIFDDEMFLQFSDIQTVRYFFQHFEFFEKLKFLIMPMCKVIHFGPDILSLQICSQVIFSVISNEKSFNEEESKNVVFFCLSNHQFLFSS